MPIITLDTQVEKISPIAKKLKNKLKKIGIRTVFDLLYYFPHRYDDFSRIKKIKDLSTGEIVTVKGRVDLIQNRRSPLKRKILTEAIISDGSGALKAVWFNQFYLTKNIKAGENIYLSGRIDSNSKTMQMISPEYEKVKSFTWNTARLVPIYPLTAGITSKQLRFLIKISLPLSEHINDWLPKEIKNRQKFMTLSQALRQIHFPENKAILEKARERLKFDELFLLQLQSQIIKEKIKKYKAKKIEFKEKKIKHFIKELPFKLTDDQKKAIWAVILDMKKPYPMNRIVNGDVGSGKTVVAFTVMLNTAYNKKQSAFMVPTEILAQQHFYSLGKMSRTTGVTIGLLTKNEQKIYSISQKISRNVFLNKIFSGEIDIVVGTHSLIQKKVKYKDLALVVIDEQHRFGVKQRKELTVAQEQIKDKKNQSIFRPHFLSMTATPIPRTLHLALFGELDLTLIKEMPRGRKKIITKIIDETQRKKAYDFIFEKIKKGRQVFVVCPLVDKSDKLGVKSVKEEYIKLKNKIFPSIKIGMLHGKMKTEEKEKIMKDFSKGKIKILAATSVVEVGMDVPNASIMIIEGAERFGLSQLHQFRGRVGRGLHQSYCFLFSDNLNQKVKERLEILTNTNDGWEIAQHDLKLRGPGEVYGQHQSGFPEFKIASLFDYALLKKANQEAHFLIKKGLCLSQIPGLKEKIEELENITHLE